MRSVEKFFQGIAMACLRAALKPLPDKDSAPADPKRILMFRADRIGDLVATTGAIRAVRMRFPRAHISLVVSDLNKEAAAHSARFDETFIYTGWNFLPLLLELRAFSWDLAIDWNTAYSASSGFLARFSGAVQRVSYEKKHGDLFYNKRFPTDDKAHRADEAMKIVAWLGGDAADTSYEVFPSASDEALAAKTWKDLGFAEGQAVIAIHPGNIKKFDNRWPEEKFAELIDRLRDRTGAAMLLMKGPGEEPLIERILAKASARPKVAPILPLLATGALLKRMRVVVCNSTGTMHLAAAVGAPTFAFLSGYGNACWRAKGSKHRALVGSTWGSCRDIPVERALYEIEAMAGRN